MQRLSLTHLTDCLHLLYQSLLYTTTQRTGVWHCCHKKRLLCLLALLVHLVQLHLPFPEITLLWRKQDLKALHTPDQGQSLFPACLSNLVLWPLVMDGLQRRSAQVLRVWIVPQSNFSHCFFTSSSQAKEQIILFSFAEKFQLYLPLFIIFLPYAFSSIFSPFHTRRHQSQTDKGSSHCVFHQQA